MLVANHTYGVGDARAVRDLPERTAYRDQKQSKEDVIASSNAGNSEQFKLLKLKFLTSDIHLQCLLFSLLSFSLAVVQALLFMPLLPTVSSFYNEDVYSVPMYVGSKIVVWVIGSLLILCLNSQKRFGLN